MPSVRGGGSYRKGAGPTEEGGAAAVSRNWWQYQALKFMAEKVPPGGLRNVDEMAKGIDGHIQRRHCVSPRMVEMYDPKRCNPPWLNLHQLKHERRPGLLSGVAQQTFSLTAAGLARKLFLDMVPPPRPLEDGAAVAVEP